MKNCKGKNCSEFDDKFHSNECIEEHELLTSEQYNKGFIAGQVAALNSAIRRIWDVDSKERIERMIEEIRK